MLKTRDVREAVEEMVTNHLLPIARRYDYEVANLATLASWKPMVLVIGNYSSGKSTLINELVGAPVQLTGQAPTDDCFTILSAPDDMPADAGKPAVVEEVPGSTLVNDASLPFTSFKSFGSRFISHFQMKKVTSPRLKNLAIIDSPGMLDSVTERDRGYDYQHVLGRLAELADLVVLIFDPHRAGTIKETYVSIRSTLPEAVGEDRVVFVMNRVDECKNLKDLVRCYGVLCWNLSQMTGRKDIPRVFLTYSQQLASSSPNAMLGELSDERDELIRKIEQAPRLQVSHLLGAVDSHLHRLELVAETMARASRRLTWWIATYWQVALVASAVGAVLLDAIAASLFGQSIKTGFIGRFFTGQLTASAWILPLILGGLLMAGAAAYFRSQWLPAARQRLLDNPEQLANLESRYRRDLWDALRPKILDLLSDSKQLRPWTPHRANAARLRRLTEQELRTLYDNHVGGPVARRSTASTPTPVPVAPTETS